MQLADEAHVAEQVGVAGEVEPVAVLELDDEADRVAEIERRLAARVPVAGRVVGVGHGHAGCPATSTVPPLFMPMTASSPPGSRRASHRLISCMHGQAGRSRLASGDRVAHVVEMAVGDEQQVAALDVRRRPWAARVAEPRVDQDDLAAGRPELEAGMAVPGERRVAASPMAPPPWALEDRRAGSVRLAAHRSMLDERAVHSASCPPRRSPRTSPSSTGRC